MIRGHSLILPAFPLFPLYTPRCNLWALMLLYGTAGPLPSFLCCGLCTVAVTCTASGMSQSEGFSVPVTVGFGNPQLHARFLRLNVVVGVMNLELS